MIYELIHDFEDGYPGPLLKYMDVMAGRVIAFTFCNFVERYHARPKPIMHVYRQFDLGVMDVSSATIYIEEDHHIFIMLQDDGDYSLHIWGNEASLVSTLTLICSTVAPMDSLALRYILDEPIHG